MPPVPAISWSRASRESATLERCSSSASAASGSSPEIHSSSRSGASNARTSPSRAANRSTTRSAPSRRAANTSDAAEPASSQCASSTRHSSGRRSDASASSVSTASETRNHSSLSPSSRPSAPRSARACGPGRSSMSPSTGRKSWCRPAYGSCASDSIPRARSTRMSDACSCAFSNSADLPTPASPRITRAALRDSRAPSRTSVIRETSASLPYSIGPIVAPVCQLRTVRPLPARGGSPRASSAAAAPTRARVWPCRCRRRGSR